MSETHQGTDTELAGQAAGHGKHRGQAAAEEHEGHGPGRHRRPGHETGDGEPTA